MNDSAPVAAVAGDAAPPAPASRIGAFASVAAAGRLALPLAMETGSSHTISSIRLPRTTISAGPIAGVPAPSTIKALRMTRDSARLPETGAVPCAVAVAATSATSANDFNPCSGSLGADILVSVRRSA